MAGQEVRWSLAKRARARLKWLIQTKVWGMDIKPSARIDPTALIDRTWPKGIHIGADCVIGEEAVVLTHDLTRGIYFDTTVGARTRIGPRAIILPGVTIGEDSVIMPGALVRTDVPPRSVALGNPARLQGRETEIEDPDPAGDHAFSQN